MLVGNIIGIIGTDNSAMPKNLNDFFVYNIANINVPKMIASHAALDQVNTMQAKNKIIRILLKNFAFFAFESMSNAIKNGNMLTKKTANILGFSKSETTRVFIIPKKL